MPPTAPRMQIRWQDRDAVVEESSFEPLVRAGLVPEDAWIVSPTYTRGHAVQARDLEVYHLWRPEPPEEPPGPSLLSAIYLDRAWSVTTVLILVNLVVAAVLAIRWGQAYPYELSAWAAGLYVDVRSLLDAPRLIAPNFVHAGPSHLFGNLLFLFAFGAVVEFTYGMWRMALVYVASGYAGSVLSYLLLHSDRVSVGASGAIFGLMGATLVLLLRHHRSLPDRPRWRARRIYIPLVASVVVYALTSGNLWGHLGGLVGGLVTGALLCPRTLTGTGSGRPLAE